VKPDASEKFTDFCVINYGLKSVACFAFASLLVIHATDFSQWLMTEFLSDEFIRRFGKANLKISAEC
jgi:hypothetical protein